MAMTDINHGEPYFLKADISKAGEKTASINDYIKMRVFDNGKILPVKWFDQNVVMNVNGMIPFIEGSVGQFSTDDNDNIIMSPDAVHRDWQGTAANTRDGGWADYILTDQMFTEEGAFSGFIGLMDGNGRRLTSINIWFRVLGDNLLFGLTQKYYSDKIEKFIRQMQAKANDTFRDINDKYDREVSAHSNALKDSTAALESLAATAGSIKSELEAKNYVEYADFTKSNDAMRNAIDDRLKHISLTPETFSSLDDLKQKYPTGKDGLFRVGDTGYIFENGQWTNSGLLSSTVVSDADFNQRVGSFMFFSSPNDHIEIEERFSNDAQKYIGNIEIPSGALIYLADNGKFKSINTFKLDYSYTQQEVNDSGVLTLYFDNNSELYLGYTPQRRNDVKLFSIYNNKVYGGINIDRVFVNGIAGGGWGQKNRIAKAMAAVGDQPIKVTSKDYKYVVDIPDNVNFIDENSNHWLAQDAKQQIEFQSNNTTVINLYLRAKDFAFYLAEKAQSADDWKITALYNNHAYGPSNDDIVVNGISNGGFGENSVYGYSMYLPMYDNDNHIDVTFSEDDWSYKVVYPQINIIGSNGTHYICGAGETEGKGDGYTTLNLYLKTQDAQAPNLYLDTISHNSKDVFIATLYGAYAYGQNVQAFVVNGISNGGFGKVREPYTLTDWRIDAYSGKEANIAWLGDSTFEGFKVKDSNNIAANYINTLLINDFPTVRSYNCSRGGWTTWDLADHFKELTKDVPAMKLLIIGGGINDRKDISRSRKALDQIVKAAQKNHIVPVICTTQASALLYASQSEGGDWTLEQDWYAKTNEMRRIYAQEHNIPLIDLEKYDTKFIEYGPNKLSEMFDDQMHGHDPIHKFEAQLVMSYLAKDHVDIIEEDTPVTVTTMKARSDSTYNLTSQELDNSALNAKGFKAHMSRQKVNQDLTILDYQFFIPAGYKKYYLNGYNLGDPVSVSVNGEKSSLSSTEQIKELEPGYYHILVKPTTDKFDFVGLRIEEEKVNEK